MFRFTIRDVLWFTVVVAMGAGWWMHNRAWQRNYDTVLEVAAKEAHESWFQIFQLSTENAKLKKASQQNTNASP